MEPTNVVCDDEHKTALKFCNKYLDGAWRNVSPENVNVTKVRLAQTIERPKSGGGMSNLLYRCALDESVKTDLSEPRQVLLRIYGGAHSDISVQLDIFNLLAGARLGPRLYSSFGEGRFEEYLPASPLSWTDLTDDSISRIIARKIAAIHKLNVQSLDTASNWLMDKYNFYHKYLESTRDKPISYRENTLDSTKTISAEMMSVDFKTEIDFMSRLFDATNAPLVFSHNDLHQNNIILLHDAEEDLENRIVLIDFEYSHYNYRTFDLANHLSEWCFDYNGDEYPHFTASLDRFPSEEKQRKFLLDYLSQANNSPSSGACDNDSEDLVDRLFHEMQPFFMASNLLWSIWAIHGARSSRIEFGYWEMAKYKWDIYQMCKAKFERRYPDKIPC